MTIAIAAQPLEIDASLDQLIPQLETLNDLLDGALVLREQAGELGELDRFIEILVELGLNDENSAVIAASADSFSETFSL